MFNKELRIGILLLLYVVLFTSSAYAATNGNITYVRILPNGWTAEINITGFNTGGAYYFNLTGNNTLSNPNVLFSVTSEGYNSSGTLTTINRTVYGTQWLRMVYPNQTSANETQNGNNVTVRIALSDFIYQDDKNGGAGTSGVNPSVSIAAGFYHDNSTGGTQNYTLAVTNISVDNNSSLAYPKVIGRWAWPSYERATSDYLVEATAFHRSARHGKPIALMRFVVQDQTGNSSSIDMTDMTVSNRSNFDANKVLVYATTVDIDTFNPGDVINVTLNAYPWVGDASSILNSSTGADGIAQPDERLGDFHFLNDVDGTYGVGYAYVSKSGNDGTGTVYSSQAAAEAGNAYLTIENAAEALRTYHNSNHSRDNAGGGTILLAEGNFTFPGDTPASLGSSMDTWLIIKPASNTSAATTNISEGTNTQFQATRLKIEDITLYATSGTNTIRGRVGTDVLWLHNNTINMTETAPVYSFKLAYATQNNILKWSSGLGSFSTTRSPYGIIRGNTATDLISGSGSLYAVLGNKNVGAGFAEDIHTAGHLKSDNSIYAFNTAYKVTASLGEWSKAGNITHGIAVVQNVLEKTTVTTPLFQLAADGSQNTTNNIILWKNTFVGERQNLGYNDNGAVNSLRTNWDQRFNIFENWNNKDDTFSTENASRIGGWSVGHNVGSIGNSFRGFFFRGEFDGLYYSTSTNASFVDDNSYNTGDASGNGNYTLNENTTFRDIVSLNDSSVFWVLPYDILGNPIYDSPEPGAYELQPSYVSGTNAFNISSRIRIYGDEKWENKTEVAGGTDLANLTIQIPGSYTNDWIDLNITHWNNTGVRTKNWTEYSERTSLTGVIHIVSDLDASTDYVVKVDNVQGANISGDSCTSGVCTSNSSGSITFNFTGTYSLHSFSVEEQAATASSTSSSSTSTTQTGGNTIRFPNYLLDEGYTKSVFGGSKIRFSLLGEPREIRILSVKENEVEIKINDQESTIYLGDSERFNLNGDGYYDLLIEVVNIETAGRYSAGLFIKAINEKIGEEQPTPEEEGGNRIFGDAGAGTGFWIFTVIGVLVALVIGVIIYFNRRK